MAAHAPDDRLMNIILFGIRENKNNSIWHAKLNNVLHHVCGRPVEIADAYRLGRYHQ